MLEKSFSFHVVILRRIVGAINYNHNILCILEVSQKI